MRVSFLDTPVDVLTLQETIEVAVDAMRSRRRVRHVAMNVAKLVKMRSDSVLRGDVLKSDIIGIDGAGIVLGARLQGIPVPGRVAGIDLMEALLQECAQKGFKPYFLGAKEDVIQKAVAVARRRFPGLNFAGMRNGYFNTDQEAEIVAQINASGADCLFIGMPTPRKERFLAAYAESLHPPFLMGVGGSLDVLAGQVSRAPEAMQRFGLEWLHRLLQEPRRMAWRYVSTNTVFAVLLFGAILGGYSKRAT
ncbi:WecB/TagA/CpsF family glycosyltransferase [Microvirga sp. 2TAF3]|uniref:WecB/TagA/CpsF family glycosyltransferase n=1 Tax=Microvirga sp. 2TAF3 TaxID=3233014 RepID=UPI003F9D8C7E